MIPDPTSRACVTADEAFAELGIDRTTGYRAIKEGTFPVADRATENARHRTASESCMCRSTASRSASACSVIATNLRDTADLLVAFDCSLTLWPTGSSAVG